jgi:hypothetical protein
MKKNMILGMAVLSMSLMGSIAQAATSSKALCISMTGTELATKRVLGTAKCDVSQTMSQTELGSVWSCSFDGKSAEKLQTIATWVSDGSPEQAQTIYYDIFPQEDLGGYLLKGLNMTAVTTDGAFLEVILDQSPHPMVADMMLMTNGYSSDYDSLNITSIQNGSCASQK